MKSWITYIAAISLGVLTAIFFKDNTVAASILMGVSSYSMKFGAFLFLPLILFSLPPAVASLRKSKSLNRVVFSSILFSIVTALILPLVSAFAIRYTGLQFPASSTAGAEGYFTAILPATFNEAGDSLFSGNIFYSLSKISDFLLPAILFSLIFGFALKPNDDSIKPAYNVMNSFSTVMYRIAGVYTFLSFLLIYPVSALFFLQLINEKTLLLYPALPIFYVAVTAIITLIILPILVSILSLFRINPWLAIIKSIAPLCSAFFTGSYVFSAPMVESILTRKLKTDRKIASTAVPIFSIIGRAGSATIAAMTTMSVIAFATGAMPTVYETILFSLLCSAASFASSIAGGGFEAILIIGILFQIADINLFGAEMTVVGVMPMMSALSALIDVEIGLLGALLCDKRKKVYTIPKENI